MSGPERQLRRLPGSTRILVLSVVVLTTGCASKKRILNPDVERNPIVFESDLAAEAFDDELDDRYDGGEADIAQLKGRLSRNAFFNQQINVADHDNDGIITEAEVMRYAQRK